MAQNSLKVYLTEEGVLVESGNFVWRIEAHAWDALNARDDMSAQLSRLMTSGQPLSKKSITDFHLKPPIGGQEVWAAGVTYFRSRNARMEESKTAGGGNFYDRVYSAERPELFFKATPHRVVGPYGKVAVRKDAAWSVPEPELTLLVSPSGKILGYTI